MLYADFPGGAGRPFLPEEPDLPDPQFILRPFFAKRNEYESEKEVRFVVTGPESTDNGGLNLTGVRPGDWIDEIRLSPLLSENEAEVLKHAVQKLTAPDVTSAGAPGPESSPGIECGPSQMTPRSFAEDSAMNIMAELFPDQGLKTWREDTSIPAQLKEP